MTVKYQNNEHLKGLLIVLEDYTTWFHSLVKCIFYPDKTGDLFVDKTPKSFDRWIDKASCDGGIPSEITQKLSDLHSDLLIKSENFIRISNANGLKPAKSDFEQFITIYEEFLLYIRRLEKDALLETIGYDPVTGLRSKNLLEADMLRELDRLARQGKSFCVAMAKIDNFKDIKGQNTKHVKLIAGLIKLSIRSFDDAYYMGGDEFVLCLKQTDVTGGISALERLRKELESQEISISTGLGQEKLLSMSCCIAEPVEGDNALELITNLRADLSCSTNVKTDTVLEYHELSPLQRYIQEDNT